MRKLNIQAKNDNSEGPHIDVMECPVCGRFRESVDIDFKRWRYCHKNQVRWCIGDSAPHPYRGPAATSSKAGENSPA